MLPRRARGVGFGLWGYLLLRPGMEFVRQRSNFILGWQAAAAAAEPGVRVRRLARSGVQGVPPLGSWMILPDLTSPATQTVLPSNDALYGAAHVELDLLGPMVVSVPANIDDRYFSVAVMDAHLNNVAHIGPRWTGNGATSTVSSCRPVGTARSPDGHAGDPCADAVDLPVQPHAGRLRGRRPRPRPPLAGWPADLPSWRSGADVDPVPDDVHVSDFVHPDLNTMTDALRVPRDRAGPPSSATRSSSRRAWLSTPGPAGGARAPSRRALPRRRARASTTRPRMIDATLTTWPRINGWMLPDPTLGLPNPDVQRSAAFQQFQIGSNDVAESVYYFIDTDATGQVLDGQRRCATTRCASPARRCLLTTSQGLLVADHVRRAQPPRRQPDRPLRDPLDATRALARPRRRRLTFVLSAEPARAVHPRPTGCPHPTDASASACACTTPTSTPCVVAGLRRRSSAAPDVGPRTRATSPRPAQPERMSCVPDRPHTA